MLFPSLANGIMWGPLSSERQTTFEWQKNLVIIIDASVATKKQVEDLRLSGKGTEYGGVLANNGC